MADASSRLVFRAMGSEIAVALDASAESSSARLSEVPTWFAAWERCLSRFNPESELCALNRAGPTGMRVSDTLWEVVRAALSAAEATSGMITATILSDLEAAGYDRNFDLVRETGNSARPLRTQPCAIDAYHSIRLNQADQTIALPAGMRLDLGGIAKGWAADRAAFRLAAIGPAQVNAGGDIALSGPRANGAPWQIAIASPTLPEEIVGVLELNEGGVATSSRHYRKWLQGGSWQHHLIDPTTGRPAESDVLSATVVGPSAMVAEVAAKHGLLLGSRRALDWIDAHEALAALLVLEDGTLLESARMGRLWSSPI